MKAGLAASDLAAQRRFFAEEIHACAHLETAALVDALASVPREPFLRAGPFDVDIGLAAAARGNLAATPCVDVRTVDASGALSEDFDAILINAGVTRPLGTWLDALTDGGRIVLPLTATAPGMGPIGKGVVVMVIRRGSSYDARPVTFTAIFSAIGLRDEALNAAIGQALQQNPMPRLRTLRRDAHDASEDCRLHTPRFCLGL